MWPLYCRYLSMLVEVLFLASSLANVELSRASLSFDINEFEHFRELVFGFCEADGEAHSAANDLELNRTFYVFCILNRGV